MDNMSKSKIMFGYLFHFVVSETKSRYMFRKKMPKEKHEPQNGRGTTVERPSNAVERPEQKTWKCLNKAWICNFSYALSTVLKTQCSGSIYIQIITNGFIVGDPIGTETIIEASFAFGYIDLGPLQPIKASAHRSPFCLRPGKAPWHCAAQRAHLGSL